MHVTFTVSNTGGAERRIRAVAGAVRSQGGKEAAGGGLREAVVNHLLAMPPNKRFPAATTGFYRSAAESTTAPEVTEDGAKVSITQIGMRQRLLGGHIRQNTPGKTYLTIPAQGFAYGQMASAFLGSTKFAFVRNEEGYLCPAIVAGDSGAFIRGQTLKRTRRKKGDAYGPLPGKPTISPDQVIFWLVRSVYQQPDPSVLPTPEEMQTSVIASLTSYLRYVLSDPGAAVNLEEN